MINESNNNAAVGVGAFGCPSSTDATCTAATDSEAIKFAQTVGGLGALADNTTAAPVTATITIDVRDARGNELNTELTLPIQ
ncbi:MAG: hypothetical protein A3F89_03210 [Deltaproteobacteria bacterium RIFCSPLOWO2_12_FULL_50_11]|nr:MAG: hypothetical protein A3F89_03210 [Deltaproteobacteria bacterium RIFCSPLOWO2_12_FULL_50_11]